MAGQRRTYGQIEAQIQTKKLFLNSLIAHDLDEEDGSRPERAKLLIRSYVGPPLGLSSRSAMILAKTYDERVKAYDERVKELAQIAFRPTIVLSGFSLLLASLGFLIVALKPS